MIGSGLKKLANENGMKISNGVAYGSLKGFMSTLSEGAGWKRICIATKFTGEDAKDALKASMAVYDLTKEFRVKELNFTEYGIDIIFNDTYGTMKKIYAFIDVFYEKLKETGATTADVCTECGFALGSDAKIKLIDGAVAVPMHESCAEKMVNEINYEMQEKSDNDTGNYVIGTFGALIGAFIGSLLWAFVYYLGYIAAPVGFVIGWLANKGYDLLHGKNGKGKVAVLILATIFGVVVGTFIALYAVLAVEITVGEFAGYGLTLADIPYFISMAFMEDTAVFLKDIGMGLLFAGLGVYTLIKKTNRDVSGAKIVDLN